MVKDIYQGLLKEIKDIPTIDAHEHLPSEEERIKQKIDALYLFTHYSHGDLISSGMPAKLWEEVTNPKLPLIPRWKKFKPYWERIRYGSYARSILISIKELFGFYDLNDDTVEPLSAEMQENNKKGWYRKVLKDKSNIAVSIECIHKTDVDRTFFVPIMSVHEFVDLQSRDNINELEKKWNKKIHSLNDLEKLMKSGIKQWKKEGAVGLKIGHAYSRIIKFDKISPQDAEKTFSLLLKSGKKLNDKDYKVLQDYLMHKIIRSAIDEKLVAVIHTGLQAGGNNIITNTNPTHLTNLFMEYKEAKFDVFHGGFPYVEEAGVQGKYFPNVYLNMCWMHIMSPVLSQRALDFWLDMVPVNKIIGFGGDYSIVEKVYGHITMARENIAKVLEKRISEGKLKEKQALLIARLLLHDNPKRLYALDL